MNLFDLALIAVYLVGITLFGLRFRKKQRSLRDYFLADRNIPWWAIALSIVAAETSTLTIIGVPGLAYDTNFTFLQLIMGHLDGCRTTGHLSCGHARWTVHHPAPGARRMGHHSRAGGERRQVPRLRLHPGLLPDVHLLVGSHRRSFSHHREPRHRSIDCAATAGCQERSAVEAGLTQQRDRGVLPVLAISADRRHAVGVLSHLAASGTVRQA